MTAIRRLSTLIIIIIIGSLLPRPAAASCDAPADKAAVVAVRAQIAQQCHCTSATDAHAYKRCASSVTAAAIADGRLPSSCRSTVARCASQSTCGWPGAVTCCRTSASGHKKCSVKRSAAACRAPAGGTACVSQAASCCDACDSAGGCFVTSASPPPTSSTSTSTSTSTSSTLPPPQCTDPMLQLPPLLNVPLEIVAGSTSCGGPAFVPPASPPSVGTVVDGAGRTLATLGTNCLYSGGGAASLPGLRIPTGNQTVVSVVGLRGTSAILGPSDGNGPASCTRGAGPGRHCVDGKPGADGGGTCSSDGDCSGTPGSCALDAHCFFAPPLAIPNVLPGVDVCIVSTALYDFCGEIDSLSFATAIRGGLANRVYLIACPTCVSGRCNAGPDQGQSCSASSAGTSVDCPPVGSAFLGTLASNVELSTEVSTLPGANGAFCEGQTSAGAFGLPAARRITTDGTRPSLLAQQSTVAGPFCIARTGSPLVDATIGLPAPAVVGAKSQIDLIELLRLFGR